MDKADQAIFFSFFNEIGIIEQLARAMFEARLPKGMVLNHFTVVNHLIRVKDGQTPVQLARAFQQPKTTMTHTLAGLEARGLIEMRPNPKDARSKQVWLTDGGRAFRDQAIADLAPDFGLFEGVVDAGEITQVLPLLEQVRKTLDEARDL